MAAARKWSPAEEALLRELLLRGLSHSTVARELDRSPKSIEHKARNMGLNHEAVDAEIAERNATNARLAALGFDDALLAIREANQWRNKVQPLNLGGADSSHLLEVDLFDLHVGKLAWARETGVNYDTDIAERLARAAVEDLATLAVPHGVGKILLPLGNDFLHYDSLAGLTTAGTPQDRDSRFHHMFNRGALIAAWMIEYLAAIAPVHVLVVPGNHDQTVSWMLGRMLEAQFAPDPRVSFDSGPALRKYYRHGKVLLGFTHGDKEKLADLPLIMATERPKDWGETRYREFHIGHWHKKREMRTVPVDSFNGTTVRFIRSLSGTDAWHHQSGYVGEPMAAEAFLWHPERGQRAHFVSYASASSAS
jgi:hypothetical protein